MNLTFSTEKWFLIEHNFAIISNKKGDIGSNESS